jgi:hypothetical protein
LNKKPASELPKQPSAVIIPFPRTRIKHVPDVILVPDDQLETRVNVSNSSGLSGSPIAASTRLAPTSANAKPHLIRSAIRPNFAASGEALL